MLFRKRPSTQPPTRGTGNTRPRSYRPFVETLEDRLAPVVQSFAGLAFDPAVGGSSHLSPPDTNAAAGPQSIVEVVNNTIAIYTKTGATTASTSLNTFFANNEPHTTNGFTDPVVVYDEAATTAVPGHQAAPAGRFVIGMLDQDGTNVYYDVAVSTSNNPSDLTTNSFQFKQYTFSGSGGYDPGYTIDYDRLGWNADAFIVGFLNFSQPIHQGDNIHHADVLAISKADLSAHALTGILSVSSGATPQVLAPARMHGAQTGDPAWLVASQLTNATNGTNKVLVAKLTNVLSSSIAIDLSNVVTINTTYWNPPAIAQPGDQVYLSAIDTRFSSVDWRGGYLAATDTIGTTAPGQSGDRARARFYVFTTGGTQVGFSQQGEINQGTQVDTYEPSIAINTAYSLGMTFLESSDSTSTPEYLSMYVATEQTISSTSAMQFPARVAAGQALYRSNGLFDLGSTGSSAAGWRVGDYSATTVDPSDGTTFWSANEFATNPPTSTQAVDITGASWSANVVTITAPNNLVAGNSAIIQNMTPNGYNGTFTVLSATSTTFTYSLTTNPGAATHFGTATVPLWANWGTQIASFKVWTQLATATASVISADSSDDLFAAFSNGSTGTYRWTSGGGWSLIETNVATALSADGNGNVFAVFTSGPNQGVSKWTASTGSWTNIATVTATHLAADPGGDAFATFTGVTGTWRWTTSGWTTIATTTADQIATDSTNILYAAFSGGNTGTYKWASGTWTSIDAGVAGQIAGDNNGGVFATFSNSNGKTGTYHWTSGTGWTQLATLTASVLSTDAAGDLFASFSSGSTAGTYQWTTSASWIEIGTPATIITAGSNGRLFGVFGAGTYEY